MDADAVKARALALGFDLVGIAAAGPTPAATDLRRWLAAGYHGEMAYLAATADERADPRLLLADCRSVVVVAMSYRTHYPPSFAHRDLQRVWVSRYAWGKDYHLVLRRKLARLGRLLAAAGHDWRAAVDTTPIMERAWAAAAGLGWIGKNTQLINRRLGSELFLGVLLTTAELAADRPVAAHCGRCTACLDACPTAAFVAPGVLDARRCVAYLTVEHDGAISADQVAGLGRMVAGCDICQEVCPWTMRAPPDLHREVLPRDHRYNPRGGDLWRQDEAAYLAWRAGSALLRIPYARMRRNLALVLERAP